MPPHGEGGTREREGRRAGQREECPGPAGKVPGSGRVGVSRGAVAEGAAVPGEPRPLPALPRRLRLDQGRASSSVPVPAGQPGLGLCLLRIPPRAQVSRGEGRGGGPCPAPPAAAGAQGRAAVPGAGCPGGGAAPAVSLLCGAGAAAAQQSHQGSAGRQKTRDNNLKNACALQVMQCRASRRRAPHLAGYSSVQSRFKRDSSGIIKIPCVFL